MLSYLVGSLFILFGLIFFLYPESLRRRLRKKALRRIRRYFFAGAIFGGALLISTGWKYEGVLPKILVITGIVIVVKALFFLKLKAADKVTQWILDQPVLYLKIFAVCQVGLGVLIIFGLKS